MFMIGLNGSGRASASAFTHNRSAAGRLAIAVVAGWVGVSAFACRAALASEVDISSQVNENLSSYYNGYVYPANGGPVTIGGVGFNLAAYPGGGTGIVQEFGSSSSTFGIGDSDIRTVYTIINSAQGTYGATIGSLIFTGSGGATYTYSLTEGDNVRDHATTFYNDIAPNIYATKDYGAGDHLDVQRIILPAAFGSQTLESITLSATGVGGEPFLAAITTSTAMSAVPLPASAPMFGAALLALAGLRYRLNRRGAPKRVKTLAA